MILYDDYARIVTPHHPKVYVPMMFVNGRSKFTKKRFDTASEAKNYGQALEKRYKRLNNARIKLLG